MFYLFLLFIAAVSVVAYLALFLTHIPGAAEERLGKWEDLPAELGRWCDADGPEAAAAAAEGLRLEIRMLYQETGGLLTGGRLVRQTRYRSLTTNEIVRVGPETIVQRKRQRRAPGH